MSAQEDEDRGGLEVGLLWYDADPRRPAEMKIAEAAERHEEKFGIVPNVCHVSPEAYQVLGHQVDDTRVIANRWIRPNYFWLGVDPSLPRLDPARRKPSPSRQPAARSKGQKSVAATAGRSGRSVAKTAASPKAAAARPGKNAKSPEPRAAQSSERGPLRKAGRVSRASTLAAK